MAYLGSLSTLGLCIAGSVVWSEHVDFGGFSSSSRDTREIRLGYWTFPDLSLYSSRLRASERGFVLPAGGLRERIKKLDKSFRLGP